MTTDVNEAFAAERGQQVRDARSWEQRLQDRIGEGAVERLRDGRYRVLTGWDQGEILSARGVPQHGLDTTRGQAALYSAVPAWHALGTIIPGGTSDIDTVLELAGLDYQVSLVPAEYTWQGQRLTHADRFHTVREDTGASLGIVGRYYHVVQNRVAFEFLQDLVADFDVTWESAGALREGKKVFVSMRLPRNVTIDAGGINDEIYPFIAAINAHDGWSPFSCVVTPWRPICANTERFAVRDAVTRWSIRHTKSATQRFREARRTLGLSIEYFEQFASEETALARTDLAVDEFNKLITTLWPLEEDAGDRAKTTSAKRRDILNGLFTTEASRSGRTAYAAERSVTEYLDHHASIRPSGAVKGNALGARGQRLLEGNDDELKSKAHRRLMLLRRR
jgi:phage/plasmid-like protein (TIGR03299 family)